MPSEEYKKVERGQTRPGLSCEGDVVVHELTPGHQHHRHGVVVEAVVLVQQARHRPGVGQREPAGGDPRCRDPVRVVRGQEPVVDVASCSPVRMVEVVTTVVNPPVSGDFTRTSSQERFRTVRRDQALGGVNHGETLPGNRV